MIKKDLIAKKYISYKRKCRLSILIKLIFYTFVKLKTPYFNH